MRLHSLCREIVREHFGDIVERVCYALIQKGRLTLSGIILASKVSPKNVRESLVILIQHGIVAYTESTEGHKSTYYYSVNYEGILLRDRLSFIVDVAKEQFGETGMRIVMHFAVHGRSLEKKAFEDLRDIDNIEEVWRQMVQRSMIVPITGDDDISKYSGLFADQGAPEPPTKGKRGGKATSKENVGSKRKIVLSFEDVSPNKFAKLDDSSKATTSHETNTWRLNVVFFYILLRNTKMASLVRFRINRDAGEVMKRLLELGERHMRHCKFDDLSHAVSLPSLSSKLDEAVISSPITSSWLANMLSLMEMHEVPFVSKSDERGGGQYNANLLKVTEFMRQVVIESYIREKFGVVGCRIWRLLLIKGMLGEKEVAKLAMISNKTAREQLYLLVQSGLAFLQDVPKTLDHAPSRTFYLYYVSIPKCVNTLIDESFEILTKIKLRRVRERSIMIPLLNKLQRSDVQEDEDLITDGEKQALKRFNHIMDKLRVSEIRIADSLLILREF